MNFFFGPSDKTLESLFGNHLKEFLFQYEPVYLLRIIYVLIRLKYVSDGYPVTPG